MRDPSSTFLVPAVNRTILTVVLGKACKRCGGDRKKFGVGSLDGEEIRNLYSIPKIINVIKSERWDGRYK
jgi:hypothetical protein